MGECLVVIHHPLDQHFNLATAFLLAKQPGRNDAGIVEDQQIAGVHMGKQIRKLLMQQRIAGKRQQTRITALSRRMAGNQPVGELKIKIVDVHVLYRHGSSRGGKDTC